MSANSVNAFSARFSEPFKSGITVPCTGRPADLMGLCHCCVWTWAPGCWRLKHAVPSCDVHGTGVPADLLASL